MVVRFRKLLYRILATLFAAVNLSAQPSAGSIVVTHNALIGGPSVVDPVGNIYATVQGGTSPGGFTGTASAAESTPGAAQMQGGGGTCLGPPGGGNTCTDAFIAKTDPSGNVIFATFLGGPTNDYGSAIAIDSSGNVYVAGSTGGSFPTTAGAAIASSSTSRTFAAKISADGSKILYATYLPAPMTTVNGMGVDAEGSAYIVGEGVSSAGAPGPAHAYAVKLSADGSTFAYTVMVGGSNADSAAAVTNDAAGDAFLTGWTRSIDFPATTGVIQAQLAGAENVFVTELDPSGNIVASTFLGGSGIDAGSQILRDSHSNVYVLGTTTSPDFPTTSGAFQSTAAVQAWQNSLSESFVAKLLPDLSGSIYVTYFPGSSGGVMALGSAVRCQELARMHCARIQAEDLYVAGGYAPPGLPLTASAPLRCLGGTFTAEQGSLVSELLVHFNASGAVLDSTYVAPPGGGVFALTPGSNGSLLQVSLSVMEITFGGSGWIAPACMTLTAFNAASQDQSAAIPGGFMTLFGAGIGPEQGIGASPGQTALGGVEVFFDGRSAPVLYAQSQQVNVQAPFELAGQSSTSITLQYNGMTFGPFTVATYLADPELFRVQANVTNQALAENQDGSLNGPSNPAAPGSVVTFLGTGYPSISPACATGGLNPPGPANLAPGYAAVMNNGGPVEYAGSAPGLPCGVVQIKMQVPATAPSVPLAVTPWISINNGGSSLRGTTSSVIYVQ
jgi:uncharacterized protein (TIGR03437 family)